MKSYKAVIIITSLIVFAAIAIVNYADMPAPSKLEKKILDVTLLHLEEYLTTKLLLFSPPLPHFYQLEEWQKKMNTMT